MPDNKCYFCGELIPEGRMVCPGCMDEHDPRDRPLVMLKDGYRKAAKMNIDERIEALEKELAALKEFRGRLE